MSICNIRIFSSRQIVNFFTDCEGVLERGAVTAPYLGGVMNLAGLEEIGLIRRIRRIMLPDRARSPHSRRLNQTRERPCHLPPKEILN